MVGDPEQAFPVLVVASLWPTGSAYAELLTGMGLHARAIDLGVALHEAAPSVVVCYLERWTRPERDTVRELAGRGHEVFVFCPEAADPRHVLEMLTTGARDACAATQQDDSGLRLLVLKVRRRLAERHGVRWTIGPWTFDAAESALLQAGRVLELTPMEARLLRRLCLAAESDPGAGQPARWLARELNTEPAAIRVHISHLRAKLGATPDQPQLLGHDARGYHLRLGRTSLS